MVTQENLRYGELDMEQECYYDYQNQEETNGVQRFLIFYMKPPDVLVKGYKNGFALDQLLNGVKTFVCTMDREPTRTRVFQKILSQFQQKTSPLIA